MSAADFPYRPSQGMPPGKLLGEFLSARDMSARELARRCGRSAKLIVEILAGKAPIEPETALQLERVLEMDADLWLGMEASYRLHLAKRQEESQMALESAWASNFPIHELQKRGHIESSGAQGDRVRQLLAFFGAGSVAACRQRFSELASVSYRHSPSFKSSEEALLVWLRFGEKAAESIECADFDRARFIEQLTEIRALTIKSIEKFIPEIIERCATAGVAFALVKPLEKVALSGISRWLTPRKALIQQSLRHKANDHFWFTFYHEAAHLLLHSRKTVFLDGNGYSSAEPAEEEEANAWASNFLVPVAAMRDFIAGFGGSAGEVETFAASQGIAPGIVVGQLQKRGVIEFKNLNSLKVRFQWVNDRN